MFDQYCISISEEFISSSESLDFLEVQRPSENGFYVQELQQMRNQADLLQKILAQCSILNKQNKLPILNQEDEDNSMEGSKMIRNQSTVSIFSLNYDLNNFAFSHQDRLKFGSNGSKCLREVKEKCSAQTYKYLAEIVEESRKQNREKQIRVKDRQMLQKVSQQKVMLQYEVAKYQNQVEELRQKIEKLSKQNVEISKKVLEVQNIQKKFMKKEEALLHQRKICNNLQKEIRKQMSRLEELYESMDRKQESSCNSCSVKIIIQNNEESCSDLSKSTIDGHERSEFNDLWTALNKFENLCQTIQA